MARRLLSIWFPCLASDLALRWHEKGGHSRGTHEGIPDQHPFALIRREGNRDQIHCLNHAARSRGLMRGMGQADARAICPELATRPADPEEEARGLTAIWRLAGRWSPHIGREGADGLVLDITGVSHLFGGEAPMLADVTHRLARAGITSQSAIAPNRAAAHAFARHGLGNRIITAPDLLRSLSPLPVQALRITPETAAGLTRLGMGRVRDLLAQPRAPLGRRFGQEVLLRLDQTLGLLPETISPEAAPPHFATRLTLPEPIGLTSDVMAALMRLLTRLCEILTRHGQGARRLLLELSRSDRSTVTLEIGLARAMRDAGRMAALFRRDIDGIDAGFGIDALRLSAPLTEPLPHHQPGLAPARKTEPDDLISDLISRLGNRLGFARILRLAPSQSLIPERSFLTCTAGTPLPRHSTASHNPHRPQVIFAPEPANPDTAGLYTAGPDPRPPARFRWRRMIFTRLSAFGPERIAPEWWFDDPAWRPGLRDYWRVDTIEGRRLWLFLTPATQAWSVQGEFA